MTKRRPRFRDSHAIKAAIHRAGSTLKEISLANGLEESACKVALRRRHRAGEKAIADFFKCEPSQIWPLRYTSSKILSRSVSKPESARAASPIVGRV